MSTVVSEYYKEVFAGSNEGQVLRAGGIINTVTSAQNNMFSADLMFDEFTRAIERMHPDKSAGPDGFPFFFSEFLEFAYRGI